MSHTVMVTGADGFIGSHLTEELVKKGHKVKAPQNMVMVQLVGC